MIGVAPDGRIAVAFEGKRLVFHSTTDLTLRVVDGQGRPAPGRRIAIFPTRNPPPLETTGFIAPGRYVTPDLLPRFTGTTDANGSVVFPKLPRYVSFRITADVGFEDPMHLGGATLPLSNVRVTLANDRVLTGTVTLGATGAPLADVPVDLSDVGHGHMSGYPGTTLRTTVTDAMGRYRFTGLPNCVFRISPDGLFSKVGTPIATLSKIDAKPWTDLGQQHESYEKDVPAGWSTTTSMVLERPTTVCDFRVHRAGIVTVEILNPKRVSLKGYDLVLRREGVRSIGRDLNYRPGPYRFTATPGRHALVLQDPREKERELKRFEIRDGERQTYQFTLPLAKSGQ